jgi:hypothetical protein
VAVLYALGLTRVRVPQSLSWDEIPEGRQQARGEDHGRRAAADRRVQRRFGYLMSLYGVAEVTGKALSSVHAGRRG